jgi:hypothetical protein
VKLRPSASGHDERDQGRKRISRPKNPELHDLSPLELRTAVDLLIVGAAPFRASPFRAILVIA